MIILYAIMAKKKDTDVFHQYPLFEKSYLNLKLLLYAGPVEGYANAEDGAAQLEFVGGLELGRSIHLQALRGVVDLRAAPALLVGLVLQALDNHNLINIDVAQRLVGILLVLALLAVLVVGVLHPENLRIVRPIGVLRYANLALAAAAVGQVLAHDAVGIVVRGVLRRGCRGEGHDAEECDKDVFHNVCFFLFNVHFLTVKI